MVWSRRFLSTRRIAYHRIIAERLLRDPSVIDRARTRVETWLAQPTRASAYLERWRTLLDGPRDALLAVLCSTNEEAISLRQCTPFPGELAPRERWELWRRVRRELEAP